MSTIDLPPASWSRRAVTIATILEPYRERQPTAAEFEALRVQLRSAYKGKLVSTQTLYNLLARFRANGLDGLEHKTHRDRGNSTLPPLLVQHIKDLIITTRLSLKKVVERAQYYARNTLDLDTGVPTYDQVAFIDKTIPEDLKTLGREGVHAYRNKHEIAEQFEAEYANQLLHFDNHKLDIEVLNPNGGKPIRPWISAALDDHSRAIPGLSISARDPGSRGVALAMRHALLPKPQEQWVMQGLFDNAYFDHGKEYLSEHITDICLHLKTHIMTHEEYHPQAKGKLEQWFDTLEEDCISELDGYIGSDRLKRPARPKVCLTMEQVFEKIVIWILETYHERIHSTTGMTPRKRWLASANQRVIRLIDGSNERNLDFLLKSTPRRVNKWGIQKDNRYYLDDNYTLQPGQRVQIYYDSRDPSFIHVYKQDADPHPRNYLCTAHPRAVRVMDPEERLEVAAAARGRRKPKQAEVKAAKKRVKAIEKEQTTPNRPSSSPSMNAPQPEQIPTASTRQTPPSLPAPTRIVRLSDILKEYDNVDA